MCAGIVCTGFVHTEVPVSNSHVREKRNQLFEAEKQRQVSLIQRIEKIEVKYTGQPEDCTLIMNKNLSTPFNCAMRQSLFGLVIYQSVSVSLACV